MPKQQPGWVKSATTKNQLTVTWRDPKELIMYAKNSKLHPPEQIQQIANSITEFGFLDPIAIDENGEILEGHGRYLAAVDILNLKSVPTFQVLGLTEEQKIAYRVAHNKLTMNTDFDPDLLKIDMDFLNEMSFDLTLTGFDSEDLSSYLSLENTEYEKPEKQENTIIDDATDKENTEELLEEVVENKIVSRVKLGEIWQIGRHKIACGDSTIESNVKALLGDRFGDVGMVWADPPFNTKQQQGRTSSDWGIIENDNLSEMDFKKFVKNFANIIFKLHPKSIYVCCNWRSYPLFFSLFPEINNLIVWVKNNFGLGSGYRPQYELIIFQGKIESNSESNVWHVAKESSNNYKHPMQKPAELIEKALFNSSTLDDLIFDPFLGSAPSIIAAQKMEGNRTVYGFELSLDYCEVIIQRFEKLTGIEAKLVGKLPTAPNNDTKSDDSLDSLGF